MDADIVPTQIFIGQEFPNYPALCRFVGDRPLTGQAKIAQTQHWNNYFKWERQGHKYIITEILKPLPLAPREKSYYKDSKWYPSVSKLILHAATCAHRGYGINEPSTQHKQLIATSAQLYVHVGLCNGRFASLKEGRTIPDIDPKKQYEYHSSIVEIIYHILHRTIKSLVRQKIITHDKRYFVNPLKDEPRFATEEETDIIKRIVAELLKEFGSNSESAIFRRGQGVSIAFYASLNSRVLAECPHLESFYRVHCIALKDRDRIDVLEASRSLVVDKQIKHLPKIIVNDKIVKDLLDKNSIPADVIDAVIRLQQG